MLVVVSCSVVVITATSVHYLKLNAKLAIISNPAKCLLNDKFFLYLRHCLRFMNIRDICIGAYIQHVWDLNHMSNISTIVILTRLLALTGDNNVIPQCTVFCIRLIKILYWLTNVIWQTSYYQSAVLYIPGVVVMTVVVNGSSVVVVSLVVALSARNRCRARKVYNGL